MESKTPAHVYTWFSQMDIRKWGWKWMSVIKLLMFWGSFSNSTQVCTADCNTASGTTIVNSELGAAEALVLDDCHKLELRTSLILYFAPVSRSRVSKLHASIRSQCSLPITLQLFSLFLNRMILFLSCRGLFGVYRTEALSRDNSRRLDRPTQAQERRPDLKVSSRYCAMQCLSVPLLRAL